MRTLTLSRVHQLEEKTDKNLLNFLVVKYYTRDAGMKYDKSFNYEMTRKEIDF